MLATVQQLESYLRTAGTVSGGGQLPGDLLGLMLASASRRIVSARPDRTLERLGTIDDPVELAFPIPENGRRVFQVPDLRVVATVKVDGVALDPAAYTLRRRPRELCALWLKLRVPAIGDSLTVSGVWGPAGIEVGDVPATPGEDEDPLGPTVTADVREACLVWAARAYHNRTSRYADTVADPAGGVSSYFRNLPPDVKLVVDGLEVPGI